MPICATRDAGLSFVRQHPKPEVGWQQYTDFRMLGPSSGRTRESWFRHRAAFLSWKSNLQEMARDENELAS
jgi:hypothetical protein